MSLTNYIVFPFPLPRANRKQANVSDIPANLSDIQTNLIAIQANLSDIQANRSVI